MPYPPPPRPYAHYGLWKWPHQKKDQFIERCHRYIRTSASKAALSRMQRTRHATCPTPHGASRLVQGMSAWSVKTRRAPSRHCRDARVYGHTTTAMHDMNGSPPPPTPSCFPAILTVLFKYNIENVVKCSGLFYSHLPCLKSLDSR